MDLRIAYDFDKARKKPQGKEYMLPKNFSITTEADGLTVNLENLFNGNKFLGKCRYRQPIRVCVTLLQMACVGRYSDD